MSDRTSPESLGKAFFISFSTKVNQNNLKETINEWLNVLTDTERNNWIDAANNFCKELKSAEADS
jgi:hypothetical protein